jgi:cobalt-zinc-cadmium efflux system outer membrane protein
MRPFAFFLIALATAGAAPAQVPAPPLRLTLDEALALTLSEHPRLAGQAFVRDAAAARRARAAQRPPLRLAADLENVLGTGALGAFDDAEATLSLATAIELGGKRERRVAVASRDQRLIDAELAAERLDLLAQVARRFVGVLQHQAAVILARDNRALAEDVARSVAARAAAARSTAVDRTNAEIAVIRARLDEATSAAARGAAWAALVASWGGSPESSGEAAGNLLALPALAPFPELERRLDRNPDLARLAALRLRDTAEIDLAEAQGAPDVEVSVGARRLQAAREQALVLSASVPLGAGTRSAPATAEARARALKTETEERAARADLRGRLFGLWATADGYAEALRMLTAEAIPAARRAQDEAAGLFAAGGATFLELSAAQKQLLDLRTAAIDAAAAYHLTVIDIEQLTGATASPPPPAADARNPSLDSIP